MLYYHRTTSEVIVWMKLSFSKRYSIDHFKGWLENIRWGTQPSSPSGVQSVLPTFRSTGTPSHGRYKFSWKYKSLTGLWCIYPLPTFTGKLEIKSKLFSPLKVRHLSQFPLVLASRCPAPRMDARPHSPSIFRWAAQTFAAIYMAIFNPLNVVSIAFYFTQFYEFWNIYFVILNQSEQSR